jgi:hypothetical protein
MPDSWNPERYRERAKEWRDKAVSLPEGRQRDTCVILAEGYEELAEIIEAQQPEKQTGFGARSSMIGEQLGESSV